jgi:ABC-type amino acid transport substrate-binding protein
MPELNNDVSDGAVQDTAARDIAVPGTALPDTAWPDLALPAGRADAGIADTAVLAILGRVREVAGLPVSEHPAAYADMHDALLEALNEEPQYGGPREKPQPGAGAA